MIEMGLDLRRDGEVVSPARRMARISVVALFVGFLIAPCCRAAIDLTTVTCRNREDPSVGATLVFDLARQRLERSSGSGPTVLFNDRDIPVRVGTAAIEWEVAHNSYVLNRVTLELGVIGRVFVCQLAKRQL